MSEVISYVTEPNGSSVDVSPSRPLPIAQRTTRPNPASAAVMKQLTVSTSVVQIETSGFVFDSATQVVGVQVLTANVYVTFNGTTPSATNGFTLFSGTTTEWGILRAKIAKFIRATSTDAVLNIDQSIYG